MKKIIFLTMILLFLIIPFSSAVQTNGCTLYDSSFTCNSHFEDENCVWAGGTGACGICYDYEVMPYPEDVCTDQCPSGCTSPDACNFYGFEWDYFDAAGGGCHAQGTLNTHTCYRDADQDNYGIDDGKFVIRTNDEDACNVNDCNVLSPSACSNFEGTEICKWNTMSDSACLGFVNCFNYDTSNSCPLYLCGWYSGSWNSDAYCAPDNPGGHVICEDLPSTADCESYGCVRQIGTCSGPQNGWANSPNDCGVYESWLGCQAVGDWGVPSFCKTAFCGLGGTCVLDDSYYLVPYGVDGGCGGTEQIQCGWMNGHELECEQLDCDYESGGCISPGAGQTSSGCGRFSQTACNTMPGCHWEDSSTTFTGWCMQEHQCSYYKDNEQACEYNCDYYPYSECMDGPDDYHYAPDNYEYPETGDLSGITDCDDTNSSINPGMPEIFCNNVDENCNGDDDDINCSVAACNSEPLCQACGNGIRTGSEQCEYNTTAGTWGVGCTTFGSGNNLSNCNCSYGYAPAPSPAINCLPPPPCLFYGGGHYFEIQNKFGQTILRVDINGALWTKGYLKEYWVNPGSNDFIIQDASGIPKLWVQQTTGNIYLKGIVKNSSLFTPSGSGNFIVQNNSGSNKMWADSLGNLYVSCIGQGKNFT